MKKTKRQLNETMVQAFLKACIRANWDNKLSQYIQEKYFSWKA